MPDEPDDPTTADFDRPSAARIHDWLLDGALNIPKDREAARPALAALPGLRELARHHRAFLHRAVRHMIDAGIRQFLDLGASLPTMTPTHAIAHTHRPDIPVVYVDNDPATVAHSRLILEHTPQVAVVHADLRHPDRIWHDEHTRRLLDPTRPTGLLMIDILDTLTDDPDRIIADHLHHMAPGSALALTHLTTPDAATHPRPPTGTTAAAEHLRTAGSTGNAADRRIDRPADPVDTWLSRLTPVEPGVVPAWSWRPDPDTPAPVTDTSAVCAVAFMP
ncbi:SAM-dependent methyltransferase [Saccharothrix lopnurensis]|uniref:SAM-dependent methyltransferase n=1 Tax=Saccharothrix lopnurensis TaxID=1670621 RepID=A0ABW1PIG5_9PSEU